MHRLLEIFLIFALFTLALHGLTVGSDLLIPIVIAIVVWYLIISITSAIGGVSLFGWYIPYPLALLVAIMLCCVIIYTIFHMLMSNISDIMAAVPLYQTRFEILTKKTLTVFGLENIPGDLNMLSHDSIINFISGMAQTLTSLARSTGIICLYVLFLVLEYQSFDKKLASIIHDEKKLRRTQQVIKQISSKTQSYMRLKTLLSLSTAFFSYLVMYFVGVDFASFWAQLIFLLNFIPTVGSIIATILPSLLTILQFESWYPFFIVTITLVVIQFTMGNIIEPKLIGKSVNLSGLVIIISLALWAKIWGIAGMFLCVPIMVILNIILANFEKTRSIAIMLSSSGDVEEPED